MKFIGVSALSLAACEQLPKKITEAIDTVSLGFKPIAASKEDALLLPEGFNYQILKSWGDEIAPGAKFGFNNDFTCFFDLDSNHALLWVNHESVDPQYIPSILEQRFSVGGSVIALEKMSSGWRVSSDTEMIAKYNRRYDANSLFEMRGPLAIKYPSVIGTLANCSGGKTPWNTVLSCEENYDHFPDKYHWKNMNLDHYGWVIEVDPYDPEFKARKHSALGRFAHENACLTLAKDKRLVVYMGDDHADEHIYKFISKGRFSNTASKEENSKLLDEGTLYVAKLDGHSKGTWLELNIDNLKLQAHFDSQADLLLNTRSAAKLLSATPMARPEDLERNPHDGSIFVALTQNPPRGNLHGSILKIKENDYTDLEFSYEDFFLGGDDSGLSCPDNMVFDDKGNLWVTTDVKGSLLNKPPFTHLGNNSLFVVPVQGKNAGKAMRFASAPAGAELTGTSFSDDFKTLFLSVQHPGEDGTSSSWPHDPKISYPRPSVVVIKLP